MNRDDLAVGEYQSAALLSSEVRSGRRGQENRQQENAHVRLPIYGQSWAAGRLSPITRWLSVICSDRHTVATVDAIARYDDGHLALRMKQCAYRTTFSLQAEA